MGRPCGGCDQRAVCDSHCDVFRCNPLCACSFHLSLHSRVGCALLALENTCCSQYLLAMANGGHRLLRFKELPHNVQHLVVQGQVLWGPPPGDHQAAVVSHVHLLEVVVQGEVVTRLLCVSLISLKIMHCCEAFISCCLPRAHGVHLEAQREQTLEGHHRLVVLHVVPAQHQHLLALGPLHGGPEGSRKLLDELGVGGPGGGRDQLPVRHRHADGVRGHPLR
mmetsp:Transcript_21880/g.31771  ORF Transcript_21880/g.31771 Transcript_21880/m.31771 type:complete len:222 (-) Transcript_21880:528-1193(-)